MAYLAGQAEHRLDYNLEAALSFLANSDSVIT